MANFKNDDLDRSGITSHAREEGYLTPGNAQNGEIGENDIVFDCPNCGHSLVIDYRGAGLVVNCTECNTPVQVPIPDGMELADLDQEPEELQSQIRNLRRALYKAEEHGHELENVVISLKERRMVLEKDRVSRLHRLAEIRSAFEHVLRLNSEIVTICNRVIETIQTEMR
jgi:transcription elongation factor Elf1